LGDISITGTDVFTYGNSNVFTLTESNVNTVTRVYRNNIDMGDSEFGWNSDTNKVTITLGLTSGDNIQIEYTYYPNYSSTEIQAYARAALVHLSANNYYTYEEVDSTIYPDPSEKDVNLIAMVASLLIEPDNKTYRLPDVSVNVPKDLPTHEKIRRTIMIAKKSINGWIDIIG
jgi:hypothetical protein